MGRKFNGTGRGRTGPNGGGVAVYGAAENMLFQAVKVVKGSDFLPEKLFFRRLLTKFEKCDL